MMDARLGFAVFVLAMCALDLVWTASVKMDVWWRQHVAPRQKRPAREQGRPAVRSDWYAFFHCADLVGREQVQKENTDSSAPTLTKRKSSRPRARLS